VFNIRKTALDFEQQLGDYEKELKMLRVKLDAANNELECNEGTVILLSTTVMFVLVVKQTLVQSSVDNANQLNVNGQKTAAELESVKQESAAKSVQYESEIERLKQGKRILGWSVHHWNSLQRFSTIKHQSVRTRIPSVR
jgi:hypothetical protein